MKLYLLSPAHTDNADAATRKLVEDQSRPLIASLIIASLEPDFDPSLHAVSLGRYGNGARPSFERLVHADALVGWISASLDPKVATSCEIRSLLNCRSVRFGYDGQAYLCLRADDPEPRTPDGSPVVVEECSSWLLDTDYMDGFAPRESV